MTPGRGLAALGERTDANHQFFDRYSFSHAAMGVLFEASRIPPWLAIGSHVAFEAVENGIKRRVSRIWPDQRPDGWENHLGDVASFVAGYYGARAMRGSNTSDGVLSAFVGVAAVIWTWNLLKGHTWGT